MCAKIRVSDLAIVFVVALLFASGESSHIRVNTGAESSPSSSLSLSLPASRFSLSLPSATTAALWERLLREVERDVQRLGERDGERERESGLRSPSSCGATSVAAWRRHMSCATCIAGVELLDTLLKLNVSESEIFIPFIALCHSLTSLDNAVLPQCPGFVRIYGDVLFPILVDMYAQPHTVCDALEFCGGEEGVSTAPSSSVSQRRSDYIDSLLEEIALPALAEIEYTPLQGEDEGTFHLLQLSDIHLDPEYREGTRTYCGDIVCCREEDGPGNATQIGDPSCDASPRLVKAMMDFVRTNFSGADAILFTGDMPPHDLWEQTEASQYDASKLVLQDLLTLSEDLGIPVYPVYGNHEGSPANIYDPNGDQYVLERLVPMYDVFFAHLDNATREEVLRTLHSGVYYTTLIAPKLRLIALNTQLYYLFNFYVLSESLDPQSQLEWLVRTLVSAAKNNERVILTGHVPPMDSDFANSFAAEFQKILNVFDSQIVAQFFGHTHTNEFTLQTALRPGFTDPVPVAVVYVSPSITPLSGGNYAAWINPSMREYYLNQADNYNVLDYVQYYMNLTEANEKNQTRWDRLYSAKERYGLSDLGPDSWWAAAHSIGTNSTLAEDYLWLKHSAAASRDAIVCQTKHCRLEVQCSVTTYTSHAYNKCVNEVPPDV